MTQSRRLAALTAFGETVATLPFDAQAVRQALVAVEEQGGQELVVETLATMMTFESITRVVDATIRVDQLRAIMKLITNVVISFNKVISAVQSQVSLALTVVVIATVAVVAKHYSQNCLISLRKEGRIVE
jgi:hypothetical protein